MAVDTIRSVAAAAHRTGRPRHGAPWHGYCLLMTVSERGVLSAGSGRPLWPVTAEQNTRRRAVSGYMEKKPGACQKNISDAQYLRRSSVRMVADIFRLPQGCGGTHRNRKVL